MDYSNEYDDTEIKMLNGRCIMNALAFFGYEANENELLKHIVRTTDYPEKLVKDELNQILDFGLTNGFIMKNDSKYVLPRQANVHQVDSPPIRDPPSPRTPTTSPPPSRSPSSPPALGMYVLIRTRPDGTSYFHVVHSDVLPGEVLSPDASDVRASVRERTGEGDGKVSSRPKMKKVKKISSKHKKPKPMVFPTKKRRDPPGGGGDPPAGSGASACPI